MRRILFAIAFVCVATASYAQNNNEVSGTITAAATACTLTPSAGCVSLPIGNNTGAVTVNISGTFSGTLLFEAANDNSTFGAIQGVSTSAGTGATSATSAGTWQFAVSGMNVLHVRGTPFASGSAVVSIRAGQGSPFAPATISGTFSGNAAASTTGIAVPAAAGYTGVIVGGNLVGVSGTGTSMNVNVTGGVATGVAQGSTTSGQLGSLTQCAVTTAAPSYTTAQTDPLSCDTSGNLRVSAGGVAQGSTTSGQTGFLNQGAVTTAAPSYTTGQTDPLSLDTSGNLRVLASGTVTANIGTTNGLALNSTLTGFSGTIASGGVPTSAVLMGFKNNAGTQMVALTLDASGNVPVSGSLSVSPNATFGSAAPSTGFMQAFRNGANADYGSTNGNHQQQVEIANITAAASGPQNNAGSDSTVISPYQLSWTDRSISLTTGGTSQTIISSNSSRHGYCINNPVSATEQGISTAEDIAINWTSAASLTSGSFILPPGASWCEGQAGQVTTETVTVIAATTGHKIPAKER